MTILTTTSGSSDHNSNTASHGSKDTGDDTGTPAIDTGYVRADDDDSVLRAARNAVSDTEHGYGPPYHGAGTHQQQRQQVDQYNCSGAGNYGPRPYVLGSLHRDYLRDLEDGVVLALPWPTQKDLEDVQALLSKRTAAKKFYQRLAFRSALACVLLIGVWLFIVVADGRREDDGGGNEDENTRLDEVTRKIFGFLALILTLWWCIWVMHTHFDEKVQTKVRKLIDSTEGLEYNDHELNRQAPNRHDANQAAAFKLPEYVNGGAVSDNNNISKNQNFSGGEVSALTFWDSSRTKISSSEEVGFATGNNNNSEINNNNNNSDNLQQPRKQKIAVLGVPGIWAP